MRVRRGDWVVQIEWSENIQGMNIWGSGIKPQGVVVFVKKMYGG